MDSVTPPEHEMVVCPVCWGDPISRERWDNEGCCLSLAERAEIR